MADTTNIICEKGPRGFDGPRGPRGGPGEKGEQGSALKMPFIDIHVTSSQLTGYDDGDLIDGTKKIAFPLQDFTSNGLITMKKHPSGVFELLGTRVILPELAVYEYSFEVFIRNADIVFTQDISVAVPIYTSSGEAVERLHRVKQAGFDEIVKISGTGLTYGVENIWDGGSTPEKTFYLRVVSTYNTAILPNAAVMAPEQKVQGLVHRLTLKKIADIPIV